MVWTKHQCCHCLWLSVGAIVTMERQLSAHFKLNIIIKTGIRESIPTTVATLSTHLTYLRETGPSLVLSDTPYLPSQLALYVSHFFFLPAILWARFPVPVCTKNPCSTIPLNLWPWLIVTCEQHCGKHVVQVLHSPASCLCSASMEGRGGGKEERELFNPPQRNSPLNPYRELTGKSRCWKAHHTHTAVFLISSAERNLYSALESDWAAERSELYSTLECKQVSYQL